MNAKTPQNEDPLDRALQNWHVTTVLPPRFTENVWHRIAKESEETTTTLWEIFRNRLQLAFARPAVALSYALVLLLLGSAAGYWQARRHAASIEQSLGASYVLSVDPYQKTQM